MMQVLVRTGQEGVDPVAPVMGTPILSMAASERRRAVLRGAESGVVDVGRLHEQLEAAVKRADQEAALDAALEGVEAGATMRKAAAGVGGRGRRIAKGKHTDIGEGGDDGATYAPRAL